MSSPFPAKSELQYASTQMILHLTIESLAATLQTNNGD
jgi:hypothetical protein